MKKKKPSSSKCKNLLPELDSKEDGSMESRRTVVSKQVITPVFDVKPGNKKRTSRAPPKPKKTKKDKNIKVKIPGVENEISNSKSTEKEKESLPPPAKSEMKGYVQQKSDLEIQLSELVTNRDQMKFLELVEKLKESENNPLSLLNLSQAKEKDTEQGPLNLSKSSESPLKSPKPKSSLEKDLEEKGLLCRVDIGKRVAATSPVKVSEVRYQTSDEESDLSPKEIKQKKYWTKVMMQQ